MRTLSQVKASVKEGGIAESASAAAMEKSYIPLFVPMGSPKGETMGCQGETGVPIHTTDIITRQKVLEEVTDSKMHSGSMGAVYSAWVNTIGCFLLMMASWIWLPNYLGSLSIYVAAVFAYLVGYYYSERLLNNAWGIGWFKGKTLIYTP